MRVEDLKEGMLIDLEPVIRYLVDNDYCTEEEVVFEMTSAEYEYALMEDDPYKGALMLDNTPGVWISTNNGDWVVPPGMIIYTQEEMEQQ